MHYAGAGGGGGERPERDLRAGGGQVGCMRKEGHPVVIRETTLQRVGKPEGFVCGDGGPVHGV